MRSVVVVLPASMWAMMPILRVLSSGYSRATVRLRKRQLLGSGYLSSLCRRSNRRQTKTLSARLVTLGPGLCRKGFREQHGGRRLFHRVRARFLATASAALVLVYTSRCITVVFSPVERYPLRDLLERVARVRSAVTSDSE